VAVGIFLLFILWGARILALTLGFAQAGLMVGRLKN
jgi:hypothetical protein